MLQLDTSIQTLDTLYIHTLQSIGLGYDLSLEAGIPTTIKLTVDYAEWFSNADIHDLNSFQSSILNGVKDSFSKTH